MDRTDRNDTSISNVTTNSGGDDSQEVWRKNTEPIRAIDKPGIVISVTEAMEEKKKISSSSCARINALLAFTPVQAILQVQREILEIDGIRPHPVYNDWFLYHRRGDANTIWTAISAYTPLMLYIHPDEEFYARWKDSRFNHLLASW